MSADRAAEDVGVVLALRRALGFLAAAVLSVEIFDERGVGLVAVLPFSVILCALLIVVALSLAMLRLSGCVERNRAHGGPDTM